MGRGTRYQPASPVHWPKSQRLREEHVLDAGRGCVCKRATFWRPLVGLSPLRSCCWLCDPGQVALSLWACIPSLVEHHGALRSALGPLAVGRCSTPSALCPSPRLLRHPPGFVTETLPPWSELLPVAWPCPLALPGSHGGEVVEGTGVTHSWLSVTCSSWVPGASGNLSPHTYERSVATAPMHRAAAKVKGMAA